jgi:hypothetical protein
VTFVNKYLSTEKLGVITYAVFYCIALIVFFGFDHRPWTDEEHFYFTVLEFIQQPTLHTLKHYEEMSTPLPFVVYALWGSIFGDSLAILRVFSLFITFTTILSAFCLFKKFNLSTPASYICIFILTINPYFMGVGFFVYTDLLCELCMLWVFISLMNREILISCTSLLFAILCRQYMVFFLPVMAIYLFSQHSFNINRILIKQELSLLIPVIGFTLLLIFWGGANPDNTLQKLYVNQAFVIHYNSLTAYMAASMVYTFPLLLLMLKDTRKQQLLYVISLSVMWFVFFPVQGSQVAIDSIIHIDTIGMIHKATHTFPDFIEQGIWLLLFICSCLVFVIVIEKAVKNYQSPVFLICLSWFFFLLTMSLSYLTWEKYLLPILPLLLVLGGSVLDTLVLKQGNRIGK